jgi:Tfp pilus assembly protein PilF
MTLNITVATERVIYQCADCRYTDLITRAGTDAGSSPKLTFISANEWHATVCFNGVADTRRVKISDWLVQVGAEMDRDDSLDVLIDRLLAADDFLVDVRLDRRHHSFIVGAFVGSSPRVVLISNYESFFGLPLREANESLSVSTFTPKGPKTFVHGQYSSVHWKDRNRLTALASANGTSIAEMYGALAEVNRTAARKNTLKLISAGCVTTHVTRAGDAGGQPNGIVTDGGLIGGVFKKTLDDHFGVGKYSVRQFVGAKLEPTDDYHATRLVDKPNDPDTHIKCGDHLMDQRKDPVGAERAYRKALELDPDNVGTLGRLARLKAIIGESELARTLCERALMIDPQSEDLNNFYAEFLSYTDRVAAREVVNRGLTFVKDTRRLRLVLARLDLLDKRASVALQELRLLREQGADQRMVERGIAMALQVSGAPIDECINAYRTATAVNPKDGPLLLNLAQLLLARGNAEEGERRLREAIGLRLDSSALLEAQFYLLAHTKANPIEVFDSIKRLRADGTTVDWNFQPNIEAVRRISPQSASILADLADALTAQDVSASIDPLIKRWQSRAGN